MFLPLTEKEIKQIVVLQIKSVQNVVRKRCGTGMTDAAIDFLANAGYDPEFGARPVKRAIQHYLLNDLSKKLLSQDRLTAANRLRWMPIERKTDWCSETDSQSDLKRKVYEKRPLIHLSFLNLKMEYNYSAVASLVSSATKSVMPLATNFLISDTYTKKPLPPK